ncbi:MAG: TlpA disulfide reductase family protein [Acidobacteriota bacterium]
MKFLLPLLLATVSSLPSVFAQQTPRLAPEFTIHMGDGSNKLLSSYRGKVVVLALMQTGCPHCQHFAQQLGIYQREYGPKGVQVLGAVFDTGAKAGLQRFVDQFVRGFPVGYSDEATVMSWLKQPVEQGYFVPILAFINRRGQIVSQHLGDDILFQDPNTNIRHTLDRLLK